MTHDRTPEVLVTGHLVTECMFLSMFWRDLQKGREAAGAIGLLPSHFILYEHQRLYRILWALSMKRADADRATIELVHHMMRVDVVAGFDGCPQPSVEWLREVKGLAPCTDTVVQLAHLIVHPPPSMQSGKTRLLARFIADREARNDLAEVVWTKLPPSRNPESNCSD